ncbi:hypothetical protein Kpol_250p1 [Vanderwaltozyma polyspora DSM 70294]|uniref:BZIP domain-containing protein n=1 Tax=Vanderwaltozyma polyspora (strain ATCC 22028 / DSM 70294 / BCRC 21397 / CBS 2163 / NBRC 10782 / NRRL Y-8283 / UCD 57-17) TaxID=436907 RepID=A7TTB0_VANPO|nr:uncharacterized protein Kpol_250p1 [Vanderwaltozyma polyspora DSM 70294]EDO14492.1 hypothetical protein Kpol_250p1 [Vanderwaltozyma polyspora DSM 70294]
MMSKLNSSAVTETVQNLIKTDVELGSQLLSLLLISRDNSEEIINAINKNVSISSTLNSCDIDENINDSKYTYQTESINKKNEADVIQGQAIISLHYKSHVDDEDDEDDYKDDGEDVEKEVDDDVDDEDDNDDEEDNDGEDDNDEDDEIPIKNEESQEINNEDYLALLEKRRRNTEASARFRLRRKQKYSESLAKLDSLNVEIKNLNLKIDELTEENKYWKNRLNRVNEMKSNELLYQIRKKSTSSF